MTVSEWKRNKKNELSKPAVHKKISNTFVESTLTNKTVSALRIIYYLANILKDIDYKKELTTVIINTKDILEYTELKITDIKNNFKKMQETSISFINREDEYEEMICLIPRIKIHPGRNRTIEIDIYSKIANLIVEVTERYSFINTKQLMKLKFKHSIRLLPILEMINQYELPAKKQKKYSLKELNDMFDTKYRNFSEIERKILIKAKEELNNNSSLTFDYLMNFEVLGTGRSSIVSVTLIPKEKKSTALAPATKSAEPIEKSPENSFSDLYDHMLDDNFHEEFDVSPANVYLINKFYEYLKEQVKVFKIFCEENNKNYANISTSFKRHIRGAYKNNLDFFVTKEYLNRKEDEYRINEMKENKQIEEFLMKYNNTNFEMILNDEKEQIFVINSKLFVSFEGNLLAINDKENMLKVVAYLKNI